MTGIEITRNNPALTKLFREVFVEIIPDTKLNHVLPYEKMLISLKIRSAIDFFIGNLGERTNTACWATAGA